MPTPPLPLTSDPRTTAWRAVVEEIQADDDVRGLVGAWLMPEDNEGDDPPPREVVTVRVIPTFGAMSAIANLGHGRRTWESQVLIGLEIMVPGDSADNSGDVWGAIEQAILGTKLQPKRLMERDQRWADAGVFDIADLEPAMTPMDSESAIGNVPITCMFDR